MDEYAKILNRKIKTISLSAPYAIVFKKLSTLMPTVIKRQLKLNKKYYDKWRSSLAVIWNPFKKGYISFSGRKTKQNSNNLQQVIFFFNWNVCFMRFLHERLTQWTKIYENRLEIT